MVELVMDGVIDPKPTESPKTGDSAENKKNDGEIDVIIYFNAKGISGVDIDEVSRYGRKFIQPGEKLQDEVLFMAGSKFNVSGYRERVSSNGETYVEMILNEIQ